MDPSVFYSPFGLVGALGRVVHLCQMCMAVLGRYAGHSCIKMGHSDTWSDHSDCHLTTLHLNTRYESFTSADPELFLNKGVSGFLAMILLPGTLQAPTYTLTQ